MLEFGGTCNPTVLEGDCLIDCDELFLVGWVIDGDLLEPALPIILKSSNPRSFALSIIVNILVLDGLSFAMKPRYLCRKSMCIFHFSLIILSFKSKLTFRIFTSWWSVFRGIQMVFWTSCPSPLCRLCTHSQPNTWLREQLDGNLVLA